MQVREQFAIGHHGLEAQNLVPGIAIAENIDTTGIGGQISTDLATAFCGETEWEKSVGVASLGLKICEDTTCLNGHRIVDGIKVPDSLQAFKAENNLIGLGHSASTEPGIASLRNQRSFFRDARPHHRLDFSSITGPDDDS